jgi:RNA polymerase sigma factor (sigma-70 family)
MSYRLCRQATNWVRRLEEPVESVDEGSLKARLEALHPDAFGWALSCCHRNADTAREVLQMVYLKVLEGRAQWDGRSAFRTWLFAVLRKTAADYRRRAWLRSLGLTRFWINHRDPEPQPDPEVRAKASEAVQMLRKALVRLPPRQREVLHLVFYHGLTVDEAAGVLDVTPGAARRHYERAKRRLRELLPREVGP